MLNYEEIILACHEGKLVVRTDHIGIFRWTGGCLRPRPGKYYVSRCVCSTCGHEEMAIFPATIKDPYALECEYCGLMTMGPVIQSLDQWYMPPVTDAEYFG